MIEDDLPMAGGKVRHPISAAVLKPVVASFEQQGKPFKMGMVFPVSTHNYELRYWLAAAGIHPGMYTPTDIGGRTGAEVELSVTPPPMMPSTLEAGNIDGYCVGEPWNQQAIAKGIGVPVVTNYEIYRNKAEKVFGVSRTWADTNPRTHIAVVKSLIRACKWLDETDASGTLVNREEACRIPASVDGKTNDVEPIQGDVRDRAPCHAATSCWAAGRTVLTPLASRNPRPPVRSRTAPSISLESRAASPTPFVATASARKLLSRAPNRTSLPE